MEFRRRVAACLCALACVAARAQDYHLAPGDSLLAESAESFVDRKRIGALLLWGGMLVASLLIGIVRARNRRSRT